MWVAAMSGLVKFDGTTATTYTAQNSKLKGSVMSMAFDTQGNKWIGTRAGLSKFNCTSWTTSTYNVAFDASRLSSGIYIYRLNSGSYTESKKLMLMK